MPVEAVVNEVAGQSGSEVETGGGGGGGDANAENSGAGNAGAECSAVARAEGATAAAELTAAAGTAGVDLDAELPPAEAPWETKLAALRAIGAALGDSGDSGEHGGDGDGGGVHVGSGGGAPGGAVCGNREIADRWDLRGGWRLEAWRGGAGRASWLKRVACVRANYDAGIPDDDEHHDEDNDEDGGNGGKLSGGGRSDDDKRDIPNGNGGGVNYGDCKENDGRDGHCGGPAGVDSDEVGDGGSGGRRNLGIALEEAAMADGGKVNAATTAAAAAALAVCGAGARPGRQQRRTAARPVEAAWVAPGMEGRLGPDGGPIVCCFRHDWVSLRDPGTVSATGNPRAAAAPWSPSPSRRGGGTAEAKAEAKGGGKGAGDDGAAGGKGQPEDKGRARDEHKGGGPSLSSSFLCGAKEGSAFGGGHAARHGRRGPGRSRLLPLAEAKAPSSAAAANKANEARWPAESLALPHPDGCDGPHPRANGAGIALVATPLRAAPRHRESKE